MSNRTRTLASAALTGLALLITQSPSAGAADIYDKYGGAASPYEDPRYADIYGMPPPPQRYAEPRYAPPPPEEPRFGRPYFDRDLPPARDRYGYLRPMTPQTYRADERCLPRSEIRRALAGEGWRDFEDLELRGSTAMIRARRPTGQSYALEVDRCTGDIVHARPLDERPVPYAYRDRYGGRAY